MEFKNKSWNLLLTYIHSYILTHSFYIILLFFFNQYATQQNNLNWIGKTICLKSKTEDVSVTLLTVQNEVKIKDTYSFITPQVNIECKLTSSEKCQTSPPTAQYCNYISYCLKTDKNNKKCLEGMVPSRRQDISSQVNCTIDIKPNPTSRLMKAFKLNRNSKITYHELQITKGDKIYIIKIPDEFKRVIINDDLVLIIKKSNQNFDPLLEYQQYIVEDGFKDLKTEVSVNEIDEWDLEKLGWFRQYQTNGKFVCNRPQLLKKLSTNYDCENLQLHCSLNAVHYYNSKRILQREVVATSLNQLTENTVSDVNINFNTNILVVNYTKILARFLYVFLAQPKDTFYFTASFHVDKFANRIFTVKIFDETIDHIIIEIGIPGSPIHSLDIYHNGRPKEYKRSFSADIIGDQWICCQPLNSASKLTCRIAKYTQVSFRKPKMEIRDENMFLTSNTTDVDDLTTLAMMFKKYNENYTKYYTVTVIPVALIIILIGMLVCFVKHTKNKIPLNDEKEQINLKI